MSYDPRTFELALHFAADLPRDQIEELAEHLQASAEIWLQAPICKHGVRMACRPCIEELTRPDLGGEG